MFFKKKFLEYRVFPFILCYFSFLISIYYKYISSFKADLNTLINYYFFRKKINLHLKIPKPPKLLTIVPINACNARCVFCAYKFLKYKKEKMPLKIFVKIINEYKELGGKKIMLSPTIGEVLLDNTFFEKVQYAKEKGFSVYVFTNGILLNKQNNFKKIIDSGIDDLFISIGDILINHEREIFGISKESAYQKIIGILSLLDYKLKKNSKINITLVLRAKRSFRNIWNSLKSSKFKYYYEKQAFHIKYNTEYDNWCGNIKKEDLIGIMKLKTGPLLRKYPCSSLWEISILPNGNVRLCGCRIKKTEYDELVIGNILNNTLYDIITNKKGQKILKDWSQGYIPEVCKDCNRYSYPKFHKKIAIFSKYNPARYDL